ncbi:MAG TPA: hypothetical protein VME23_22085 [Terracidiphilus sp.]|nr:hypothetical protein [Terracidiphilus sp.]
MSESANREQELGLRETDPVARMTRWEKCGFWIPPVCWGLCAVVPFFVSASFLMAFAVSLLIHFQGIIHHPDWLKNIGPSMAFLAGMLVISGALLVYPVSAFRKMARRKKESGSIYPSGEELIARRNRWEHPPAWLRIVVVLFFCLVAFAATHAVWADPGRYLLLNLDFPALFWLIAIMVAIDVFWPRVGRQWTGFVASGAFGLLAIIGTVAVIRHGNHKASDWGFPLLMASFAVFLAVASVHEGRKKVRITPASQAP